MAGFDFLQAGTIVAIAGILVAIIFNSFKERRERRNERIAEAERKIKEEEKAKARGEALVKEVKDSIAVHANDLRDRLDDKLEVIRVTTSGLHSNLEEFKVVNRDELLSIKREIEKLKAEADNLNQQVQAGKLNDVEVQSKMANIKSQLENLEERVKTMEVRISNREGISSTR